MATTKRKKKKRETAPAQSRGLEARRLGSATPPTAVQTLARTIEDDGGSVLATYRDPLGSHWQILAALPLDRVEPTPFQRDLSEAHVGRVANAIDKLDRYLDPVIAVPAGDGKYWSPNGYHRLGAMKELGARSIVALVVPEPEVAHRILLLNTEKAHNLRERALEVARLAEALAALDDRPERRIRNRVRGTGARHAGPLLSAEWPFFGWRLSPILKRCDKFLGSKLPTALETPGVAREAARVERTVNEAVKQLKGRGLESPYLKALSSRESTRLRFQRKPRLISTRRSIRCSVVPDASTRGESKRIKSREPADRPPLRKSDGDRPTCSARGAALRSRRQVRRCGVCARCSAAGRGFS
jgi:ParB family chromosome partitioning protein